MRVGSISESVRYRFAVAALCLALSVLILYRAGAGIDERRGQTQRRAPSRPVWGDVPQVRACEMLVSSYSPFAGRVELHPGVRLMWIAEAPRDWTAARLARFKPIRHPFDLN
jgi:hypothetical protein